MSNVTSAIKSGVRCVTLIAVAAVLGGCATYNYSHAPGSGVYYAESGGYRHAADSSRGGYRPLNPVDYPYWSLDYFYFSQYHHPYSVYVGYSEPLYYPYPGWAFGHHHPVRGHRSTTLGFGYPWHGYGSRYPAYSFGFFAGHGRSHSGSHLRRDRHNHRRIRDIDRRLEALRQGDSDVSRRELLARDRDVNGGQGRFDGSRRGGNELARSRSRADMLPQRSATGSSERQASPVSSHREETRRASRRTSERRSERRLDGRNDRRVDGRVDGRVNRRAESRANPVTRKRERIRRDEKRKAGNDARRGIPVDNLRGRVIISQGNSRRLDSERAKASPRRREAAGNTTRRTPASESHRDSAALRQPPARSALRAAPSENTRGRLLMRNRGSVDEPASRPDRNARRSEASGRASRGPARRPATRSRSGENSARNNRGLRSRQAEGRSNRLR